MLTADEAELYDRQIRLWGVNAQGRLRQSKVLMLGFNGVASEVAKILVLAGIDTLTIVDDQPLQDEDLNSNLFCRTKTSTNVDGQVVEERFRTHQVRDKLKTLNPLVKVNIDNSSITAKKSEYFLGYDLVTLHSILTTEQISDINDICRKSNIKFYLVIDFGFFGFMFNDLGPEFKYTYEQYDGKKKEMVDTTKDVSASNKQAGKAENPISFDDEQPDVGYGSSDDEDSRPKKRRRLENHDDAKDSKPNEEGMKHLVGSSSYVTFCDMISFKGAKFDRKTSPVLFISIAMMKFFSEYKHLPTLSSVDTSKLNEIIASMKDSLQISDYIFKKLDPTWSQNIAGSYSPICAIVGGVAGQDMIRALSGKDIPICNTFSFDGIEMSGAIERLGLEDKFTAINGPVVRDFLQIEDSN